MTQAQRILNNRYELLAKVGDGGMAVVYKARDIMLNRTVAVKILRESYASDPAFLQRFNREAQAAANLNHPNIVNVFDVGHEGDIHYIVMEFIEGSNLKDLIIKQAPFPAGQAIETAAEICDAIGYAHSKGLIHRDIKPQNILLTNDGKVKVTDFGIAKGYGDQNLTQTGITLGTVHYFSPEQAKGLPVQPQSDIYSIGVVLYEMVTGRIPFESDNPVALAVKHIEELPPMPRLYNPSIPPALESIILKALSKDPAQRYPSAAAMAKALRNLESQSGMGTMVVTPPAPTLPRRPPSNQYGNNEIYSQAVQRPPYANPNTSPTVGNNQPYNGAYFGTPADYRDQALEANLRNMSSRPNTPIRPSTGYSYTNTTNTTNYGRGVPAEPLQDEFEEQPRGGPGCAAWLIGLTALAVVVALVVGGFFLVNQLNQNSVATPTLPVVPTLASGSQVQVPNVVGKSENDARTMLTQIKLDVGNESQVFDAKSTPGTVLKQDPAASQKVDVGTKINLTVSKGQETVQLPDFTNRSGDQVVQNLKGAGFQVQAIEQPDNNIQQGAVIKTDPKGGPDVQVAKGSIIKVYVSSGKPTPLPTQPPTATPVPPTPTAPPPTAAPQPSPTPPAVKVTVPDVFNQTVEAATKVLNQAGFEVKVQEWTISDVQQYYPNDASAIKYFEAAKAGTVVGMSPGPTSRTNQSADKGSTVTIGVKKQ